MFAFYIVDGEENESDEYEGNTPLQSLEFDSCISTNNLRYIYIYTLHAINMAKKCNWLMIF